MSRPSISVMKFGTALGAPRPCAGRIPCPVASELLDGRERHALREIRDGFVLGETHGENSPAKIREGAANQDLITDGVLSYRTRVRRYQAELRRIS